MKKAVELLVLVALAAVLVSFISPAGYDLSLERHTVTAGETVWEIAANYMPKQGKIRDVREMCWEIKKQNGLTTYRIQPGQVLEIPIYRERK